MKAFKFRLQTLKQLKESARNKALESYGKAVAETEFFQSVLVKKQKVLQDLHRQIKLSRSLQFFGPKQENHQRNIVLANSEILAAHTKLQGAIKIQESKRKLFLRADAEFKSLEKLNEKQKLAHDFLQRKKEDFEVDDVIGARFVYNSKLSKS